MTRSAEGLSTGRAAPRLLSRPWILEVMAPENPLLSGPLSTLSFLSVAGFQRQLLVAGLVPWLGRRRIAARVVP